MGHSLPTDESRPTPHCSISLKRYKMGLDELALRNDDPEEEEEEAPEEEEEEDEDEEDLVDPMDGIRDACRTGHHCGGIEEKYSACNDRVNARTKTEETCSEELFDLMHCMDHCMSSSLFSKLK